jgi:putative addiction module CopG family antidote
MNIRLKPELQKLVEQDVQRGPYQTADEFVERAVVLLHEQESWLAKNASQIDAQIREGYAPAQRGDLLDAESVRRSMDEKKRAWLSNQRKK